MYYRIKYNITKFATFIPNDFDYTLLNSFNGTSKLSNWSSLHYHKMDVKDKRPLPDFIDGIVPACNEKAKSIIEQLCYRCVEFLPCTVGENSEKYYLLNIINVENCIDYQKSTYEKIKSNNEIAYFTHIELIGKFNFSNETFKQVILENKLSGLIFDDSLFK